LSVFLGSSVSSDLSVVSFLLFAVVGVVALGFESLFFDVILFICWLFWSLLSTLFSVFVTVFELFERIGEALGGCLVAFCLI